MNGIIFYSNTGQSKNVADFIFSKTSWELYDLNNPYDRVKAVNTNFERAILIFPIYCQNAPRIITDTLKMLNAKFLTVIATYGKMCYGKVLYDIQERYSAGKIIAAAYFPMNHSYLNESEDVNFEALNCIIDKNLNNSTSAVSIEKTYKNILADVAIGTRSRMGVRLTIDGKKCTKCKKCEAECLYEAIKNGKTNSKCIRCLKCKTNCPSGAISHKNRLPLRLYLSKRKINEIKIYV